jgi:acyl carrier protein
MNNIEQQILQTIKDMKIGKDQSITMHSTLKEDLNLDSLSFTELLISLEEQFEIEVDLDDPELPKLNTLNDINEVISKLISLK